VTADGAVWATLQNGNQLLHIAADGTGRTFDSRAAAPCRLTSRSVDGSVCVPAVPRQSHRTIQGWTILGCRGGREMPGLSGIAVAPNDDIWFGMLRRASLGRLRDGHITVFALPRDNARPFSVAVDRDAMSGTRISGFVGMLRPGMRSAR